MSTIDPGTGLFVTFEGPDGSGKSTQLKMLAARLRELGHDVVETVEPGGTRIGQQIRRILLDPAHQELCSRAELLLYFAARAQNVEELIVPALRRGAIVLSDRYTESTMAYQGFARGLGEDVVNDLHRVACQGLQPAITLCYDIEVEAGMRRVRARSVDRMDDQAVEFHHKVRAAYLTMAARDKRLRVIDGAPAPERVFEDTWRAIEPLVAGVRR